MLNFMEIIEVVAEIQIIYVPNYIIILIHKNSSFKGIGL